MKITISLQSLSMSPEEYQADATKACTWLKAQLSLMFGHGYTVSAVIPATGFMSTSMWVSVYNVAPGSSDLDRLNAKMGIRFCMHLTDGKGRLVERDKFEFECLQTPMGAKQKGLAYRKIVGKTPVEAAKKLAIWFEKNEELLKSFT